MNVYVKIYLSDTDVEETFKLIMNENYEYTCTNLKRLTLLAGTNIS